MYPYNFKDLTGQRFEKLVVLSQYGRINSYIHWNCQCDCGKTIVVCGKDLLRGHKKSCGCMKGLRSDNKKWETKTDLLKLVSQYDYERIKRCWHSMKRRCTEKYHDRKDYYDRGISFIDDWNDFYNFAIWSINNGYKSDLTLDRIDTNGNYCPENCRWVNMKVQQNNKRNNVYITYLGKTQTMKQWSEELNIPYGRIKGRHKRSNDPNILFQESTVKEGAIK